MNAKLIVLVGLSLLASLTGCKKPISDGPVTPQLPHIPQPGVVREKGVPEGALAQKMIGAEGGSLQSADGTLTLVVPAGAVTENTSFRIQPITNTAPNSYGQAYRLMPEGQTFRKPVTLQLSYSEARLENTSASALFMAYQGADGIWKMLPGTQLNESVNTLTVESTHFSDWAPFAMFIISADAQRLRAGGTAKVTIMSPFTLADLTNNPAVKELELADLQPLSNPDNIKNWQVSPGTITPVLPANDQAVYKAPAKIRPQGEVAEVSVDVYNFIPPVYAERAGATGKATLLCRIQLGDNYFRASVDGTKEQEAFAYGYIQDGHNLAITCRFSEESASGISLLLVAKSGNVAATYPYYNQSTEVDERGKATAALILEGQQTTISAYQYGESCEHGASLNFVSIDQVETVGGVKILTGHFNATLYRQLESSDGCAYEKAHQISGEFRVAPIAYQDVPGPESLTGQPRAR